MTERGTAFLVAKTEADAAEFALSRNCERRPWGWTDPATGRRLVYVDGAEKLRGVARGALVFLVHGYNRRRDWDEINWELDNREAQRVFYP